MSSLGQAFDKHYLEVVHMIDGLMVVWVCFSFDDMIILSSEYLEKTLVH